MTVKLDGKHVAEEIRERVRVEVEEMKGKGTHPSLHVILVGEDPASTIYVTSKAKAYTK